MPFIFVAYLVSVLWHITLLKLLFKFHLITQNLYLVSEIFQSVETARTRSNYRTSLVRGDTLPNPRIIRYPQESTGNHDSSC